MSDKVISCAIACGASTLGDVAEACGAGGRCGGCLPGIEELLAANRVDQDFAVARSA